MSSRPAPFCAFTAPEFGNYRWLDPCPGVEAHISSPSSSATYQPDASTELTYPARLTVDHGIARDHLEMEGNTLRRHVIWMDVRGHAAYTAVHELRHQQFSRALRIPAALPRVTDHLGDLGATADRSSQDVEAEQDHTLK